MYRYLFADTETADMNPIQAEDGTTYGGVCEISVRDVNSLSLETIVHYHSKLDPECPISPSAAGVHGIRDADVVNCPTLAQFIQNNDPFNSAMGVMFIIAHNVKFDRKFLEPYVGDSELVWGDMSSSGASNDIHWVDTLKLARMIYPEAPDHKLQTLRVYLDLPLTLLTVTRQAAIPNPWWIWSSTCWKRPAKICWNCAKCPNSRWKSPRCPLASTRAHR